MTWLGIFGAVIALLYTAFIVAVSKKYGVTKGRDLFLDEQHKRLAAEDKNIAYQKRIVVLEDNIIDQQRRIAFLEVRLRGPVIPKIITEKVEPWAGKYRGQK